MKKFFIGLACIFILTGCSNIETAGSKEVSEDPIVVKSVSRDGANVSGNCYYGYVEIDNHIYLMFRSLGSHFGGITHSGTCPCNNSNKIEEK